MRAHKSTVLRQLKFGRKGHVWTIGEMQEACRVRVHSAERSFVAVQEAAHRIAMSKLRKYPDRVIQRDAGMTVLSGGRSLRSCTK